MLNRAATLSGTKQNNQLQYTQNSEEKQMIKTDGGLTQIKGTKSKVLAELAVTIEAIFKATA